MKLIYENIPAVPFLPREEVQKIIDNLKTQGIDVGKLEEFDDSIHPLTQGFQSNTYAFHTRNSAGEAGCYVINIAPKISHVNKFDIMNDFQHHLYDASLPVAKPMGKAGKLSDGRPYNITEFIPGCQPLLTDISYEQLENLGKTLGRLHAISRDIPPEAFQSDYAKKEKTAITLGKRMLRVLHSTCLCACRIPVKDWPVRETTEVYRQIIARRIGNSIKDLPKGYIHNDLHAGNIILENTGDVKFIDWERFQYNYLLFDVVEAMTQMCCEKNKNGSPVFSPDKATVFLHGYNSERPLNEKEIKALPAQLMRHAYWRKIVLGTILNSKHWRMPGFNRIELPQELANEMKVTYEACKPCNAEKWIGRALQADVGSRIMEANGGPQ